MGTLIPLHSFRHSKDKAGRLILILALILVCLNLADAWITLHLSAKGVEEGNPLAGLFASLSSFLYIKLVVVSLLAAVLCAFRACRALGFLVGTYIGVVGFDVWVWLQ